jgi:hypothetical protein
VPCSDIGTYTNFRSGSQDSVFTMLLLYVSSFVTIVKGGFAGFGTHTHGMPQLCRLGQRAMPIFDNSNEESHIQVSCASEAHIRHLKILRSCGSGI